MSNDSPTSLPEQPWTQSPRQILDALNVNKNEGLSQTGAQQRSQQFGPNKLRETRQRTALEIWIDQFKSLVVLLLVAAALVALAFGENHIRAFEKFPE